MTFCWKLNKKIVSLKSAREDLSILMQGFDEAIMRAEMSISELKQLSSETSHDFQKKIDKASYLTNDLSFMTDRATELSDKLEKAINLSKAPPKGNSFQHKKFLSRDEPSGINVDSFFSTLNERKEPVTKSASYQDSTQINNIDLLLKKISEVKNSNQFGENDLTLEKPFKPRLLRQDEYYKSLKKV